jgi:hypothetical protein
MRVGDENGVKFPREFGLLLKQMLYFDRYVSELKKSQPFSQTPLIPLHPVLSPSTTRTCAVSSRRDRARHVRVY